MNNLLEIVNQATFSQLVLLALLVNFGIYGCSLSLYALLTRFSTSRPMGEKQAVLRSDILLSLLTVLCNTLVFILGVLLWKEGWITLSENQQGFRVLLEVLILTLIMDLLMYVFHRSVHLLRYFRKVHERHHEHESTNLLSLFVLHPIESIGFGLMMLGVILLVPFSAPGISLYLILNSLWGTIGHLNHSVLPASWLKLAKRSYLCTSEFHYLHHQSPGYNFGFYTSVWDVLFKTIHPSSRI
ncbi:sterol desaturase family protein [Fluviicola sp.]|uniref:sterol desaturase family protein n=1 Tax=Fluviicola sp. TaxID=1917219 RepID=UPI0031D300DC